MKPVRVYLRESVVKDLKRLPLHIKVIFEGWVSLLEEQGYWEMRQIKSYRDHALQGKWNGKRSVSLNRSYRVIYILTESEDLFIDVIEVNNHDY